MSPTKLVFGKLRLIGTVIVRHADPVKLFPQNLREYDFTSTDTALVQHGGIGISRKIVFHRHLPYSDRYQEKWGSGIDLNRR